MPYNVAQDPDLSSGEKKNPQISCRRPVSAAVELGTDTATVRLDRRDELDGQNAEDMHNKLLQHIPVSGFRLLVRQVRQVRLVCQ